MAWPAWLEVVAVELVDVVIVLEESRRQKTSAKTSKQKCRISHALLSVPIMASWHPNGTCSKSSLSPEIHQICTFCRVLVVDCDGLLPFVFCGFVAQQRQFVEAISKVGNSFVHILY